MKIKFDTFTVGSVLAMTAICAFLASSISTADAAEAKATAPAAPAAKPERYKHSCSKNRLKPTLIKETRPLMRSTVSIETGRYYPGTRKPHIRIIHLDNGKLAMEAVFIHKDTRTKCIYINIPGTVHKYK